MKSGSLPAKSITPINIPSDIEFLELYKRELGDQISLAMKHVLVVNDAYGGGGRAVIRESILHELNTLKRFAIRRLDVLCYTSGSMSA